MPANEDPLASLLADIAAYAAARRAGDSERHHAPSISYLEAVERFRLPDDLAGAPLDVVIRDLIGRAEPGLAAMTAPRFFGWVIGGSHPVATAADWLTSVWGQNAANHLATPAASAAEQSAGEAILGLLDLPRSSSVGFATGATMASFTCLAAARTEVLRRVGWDIESEGLQGAPPIHVVVGEEAHSTIFAGLKYLGFGMNRLIRIAADEQGAMRPDALKRALAGLSGPVIVIAQAGHLVTGAFDPLEQIADLAQTRQAWLHVDGAFGLWARACPETAPLAAGAERADSWSTDGHKWLQTTYDSAFAIVKDPRVHNAAMRIPASYLPGGGDGLRNPSDLTPELSRRARGFAVWAVLRHLGRAGIAEMVGRHCELAHRAARRLAQHPDFRIANEVVLNQVAVQLGADLPGEVADRLTEQTIARIQADGVCFLGGTQWRGRRMLRLSIINHTTTEQDIDRSCEAIAAAWEAVRADR